MSFIQFLNESTDLSTIKSLVKTEKVFIMMIGGAASGKNYIAHKHFSELKLVDIDQYTKELSGGDFELARKFVAKGNAMVRKELEKSFKSGQSVVNVATGSGANAVIKKLKMAKENDFKTVLILIDVNIPTVLKRQALRAKSGTQGLIPDWKIEKTNKEAKMNFNDIAKESDYSLIIKN